MKERERETDRDKQRHRDRERQKQRETEIERKRDKEREREILRENVFFYIRIRQFLLLIITIIKFVSISESMIYECLSKTDIFLGCEKHVYK